MTIKQTLAEIQKGCGKKITFDGDTWDICGNTCPICKIHICLSCQSKLAGYKLALKEDIEWLKDNRDIINGIDVLDVDKRITEIQEVLK